MNKEQRKGALRQEAASELRTILKKGDTVYTVLRHVSKSGMNRNISLLVFVDGEPRYLDYLAANALDLKLAKDQGIVVPGGGMDMGFHLVYSLSCALFCADGYDHESAYALKHRWL